MLLQCFMAAFYVGVLALQLMPVHAHCYVFSAVGLWPEWAREAWRQLVAMATLLVTSRLHLLMNQAPFSFWHANVSSTPAAWSLRN